jgi:drug/metabolite transporter (DMT)-like permease
MTISIYRLIIAFLIIYVVWGSTYLFIAIAVETMPPLFLGATRFLLAGALLYFCLRLSGSPAPQKREWASACVSGGLLFLGGNGLVCWAEKIVPSGITALLIAMTPLWMTLFPWLAGHTARPSRIIFLALSLGIAGVALLISGNVHHANNNYYLLGVVVIILASISWAAGSFAAKSMPLPTSPWMSSALQMIGGGLLLTIASISMQESWDISVISARAWWSFLYLVSIGSLVGFGAYVYLLKHTTMARVSTYAFVNPLVAVLLGWWFIDEKITLHVIFAGILILSAVIIILRQAPAVQTIANSAAKSATESAPPQRSKE